MTDVIYRDFPFERVVLHRSGLHFIVYQKGRIGRLSSCLCS